MLKNFEKLNKKIILVTGAAGFLGSHICEEILALNQNNTVIAFDDLSSGTLKNFTNFKNNRNLVFTKSDANSLHNLVKIFKQNKIDFVFHHAACVGVKRTAENPLQVLNDLNGLKNIFALSYEHKIKKVIFASSSEVYGEPVEIPEREDGHLNAKIPYAVVKLTGEKFCEAYFQVKKMPTCALRFFNVYGPRQDSSDYGFVTGIFIRQVLQKKNPTIFGDGTQTRDFVFVKDNVLATIQALFNEKTNGQIINIGTGFPITILELAERVIQISKEKLNPKFIKQRSTTDIKHRFPDVGRMKKLINYKPQFDLNQGLKITYDWYAQNSSAK